MLAHAVSKFWLPTLGRLLELRLAGSAHAGGGAPVVVAELVAERVVEAADDPLVHHLDDVLDVTLARLGRVARLRDAGELGDEPVVRGHPATAEAHADEASDVAEVRH